MAGTAFAQDWPSKPVTMIVPYNPGGTTDILARLAADAISASIGQPVVVENKPGAGGVVGATLAAGAPRRRTGPGNQGPRSMQEPNGLMRKFYSMR